MTLVPHGNRFEEGRDVRHQAQLIYHHALGFERSVPVRRRRSQRVKPGVVKTGRPEAELVV